MATQNINIVISSTGAVTVVRSIQSIANSAKSALAPLKLLEQTLKMTFAALGVRQLAEWADAWTAAANKVNVFTKSQAETTVVINRLFDIAQRVRQPLTEMVTLYHRLSIGAKELGKSSNENLKFTEMVGKTLAVQGTSANQARGALVQLSQAMGMGRVRAQEWNSMIENLPLLLVTAAKHIDGAGGSVSKLRQMMLDGKLSSKLFYDAIMKGDAEMSVMFEKTNKTFGQGVVVLVDGISRYLGKLNEATGASNTFYNITKFISTNMETIGKLAMLIGIGVAGAFAPAIITMFTGALTGAAAALGRISMLLLTNPFALIAVAVASVLAFGDAWNAGLDNMTTVKDVFRVLGEMILSTLGEIGNAFAAMWGMIVDDSQTAYETLTGVTAGATGSWSDSYREFFADTGTGFAGMVRAIAKTLDAIGGLITGLIIAAGRIIGGLPAIFANVFAQAYNSVAFWIEKIVNVVINGLNTIRGMLGQDLLQTVKIEQMKVDDQVFQKYGEHIAESINDGFDAQGGYMQKKVEELFGRAQALANTRAKTLTTGNVNLDEFTASDPNSAAGKAKKKHDDAAKAAKAHQKALFDLHMQNLKNVKDYESTVEALGEANLKMKLENEMIGLTERAQLDLTTARYESVIVTKQQELASIQAGNADAGFMGRREIALLEEIRLMKERNGLMNEKFQKTAVAEAAKDATKDWKDFTDGIYSALTDSLYRGFESGKGFFQSFWDSIKNTLKTTVLKIAVQGVLGGFAGVASAGVSGIANMLGGSGASGSGSILGTLSNINTLGNIISGGITQSIANVLPAGLSAALGMTSSTLMASNIALAGGGASATAAATAAAAAGNAGALGGLGAGLAAIPGWGWAAMAAIAIIPGLMGKGDSRFGSQYSTGAGGSDVVGGPNRGVDFNGMSKTANAVFSGVNDALTKLGSTTRLVTLQSGFESSEKGKGFSYAGGQLSNGAVFGQGMDGQGYMNNRGSMNAEEAQASYIMEMKQATLQALQAATDIPVSIKNILRGSVADPVTGIAPAAVNIDKLSSSELDSMMAAISTQLGALVALRDALNLLPFENLRNISLSMVDAIAEAAGGLSSFSSKLSSYYDNYYTDEEKRAQTIANINKATAGTGFDAATASRATFRQLVESQDLTTASGQKMYGNLLNVESAFASLTTALTGVSAVITKLEENAATLRVALLRAQGNDFGANRAQRTIDTKGYTEAELAMYDYNIALQDQIDTVNLAQKAITDTKADLIDAYKQEASAMQSTVDKFRNFATDLRNFRDGLLTSNMSPLTPQQRYAEASSQFDKISAATETGTPEERAIAMGKLQQAAQTLLDASRVVNASGAQYVMDFDRVQEALSRAALFASATADVAQLQLDVAKSQLTALGDIDKSTRSVEMAIQAFQNAVTSAKAAGVTSTPTGALPAFASGGWHSGGWAMVGENGPEAAYMPAARIYTAADTTQMLGGGDSDSAVVNELRLVRKELAELRQQQNGETNAIIRGTYDATAKAAETMSTNKSKANWTKQPELI